MLHDLSPRSRLALAVLLTVAALMPLVALMPTYMRWKERQIVQGALNQSYTANVSDSL